MQPLLSDVMDRCRHAGKRVQLVLALWCSVFSYFSSCCPCWSVWTELPHETLDNKFHTFSTVPGYAGFSDGLVGDSCDPSNPTIKPSLSQHLLQLSALIPIINSLSITYCGFCFSNWTLAEHIFALKISKKMIFLIVSFTFIIPSFHMYHKITQKYFWCS